MQAWSEEGDGTLVGNLGYGRVLESPAVAYCDLQAQLLAYAQELVPDTAAQEVTVAPLHI